MFESHWEIHATLGVDYIMNLVSCLEQWQTKQPDTPLYTFRNGKGEETQRYSYSEFFTASAILADAITDFGINNGDRVLLLHPPGLELVKALFACMRVGAIATVAPVTSLAGLRSERLQHRVVGIYADCQPKICLGVSNQLVDSLADINITVPFIATDAISSGSPSWRCHPHEIALLQYTSGSTSAPKGVVIKHSNIIANAQALIDHAPISATWLPQFHDMGLIGHYLFPLVMGGTAHGMAAMDFLRRPELWLRMISDYGATFAAAPAFGYEQILRVVTNEKKLSGVDLSSLRVLMCGAEPVPPDLYTRFINRFAPYGLRSSALVTAYGLAEATLAVTRGGSRVTELDSDALSKGQAQRPQSNRTSSLCSCGPVLPGLTVQILHPNSAQSCADGEVGEICISGDSVASGYWHEMPNAQHHTVIRTKDLGFMLQGELYICGRVDDVIVFQGENYHPQDIEQFVLEKMIPNANSCVVFRGHDECITLLIETRTPETLPDLQTVSDHIIRATGLRVDRIIVAPMRSVARTTSGKLARAETRLKLKNGLIIPVADFIASAVPNVKKPELSPMI